MKTVLATALLCLALILQAAFTPASVLAAGRAAQTADLGLRVSAPDAPEPRAEAGTASPEKEWTVMVYIAGDNNLAEAGLDDVNEMETVGSTPDVNIVVQIDGSEQYTPNAPGTRRYLITKDEDPERITSPMQGDVTEADMGSKNTLLDFLYWAVERYPARKYAVILWNHGNGWYPDDGLHRFGGRADTGPTDPLKAICSDESSDNSISTAGVGDALEDFSRHIGRRIDLVGFDACLMGMIETFYELRNAAVVACGSEKTEPGDGWPYDEWLSLLAAHPHYDAEQLGRAIVETYAASYSENGSQGANNVTQSCIRLQGNALGEFEAALSLFAAEAGRVYEEAPEAVKEVVAQTQDFRVRSFFGSYFTTHKDLYDFAERMKKRFEDDDDLCAGADLLMDSISSDGGLVLANGITDVAPYGSVKNAHGLAIYLPVDGYEATYNDLDFPKTSGWLDFIHKLNDGKIVKSTGNKARVHSKTSIFDNLYGSGND